MHTILLTTYVLIQEQVVQQQQPIFKKVYYTKLIWGIYDNSGCQPNFWTQQGKDNNELANVFLHSWIKWELPCISKNIEINHNLDYIYISDYTPGNNLASSVIFR